MASCSVLCEALFSGLINTDYKDVFAFSILVLVLIFQTKRLARQTRSRKGLNHATRTHQRDLADLLYCTDNFFCQLLVFILKGYDYQLALHRPTAASLDRCLWQTGPCCSGADVSRNTDGWLAGIKQTLCHPSASIEHTTTTAVLCLAMRIIVDATAGQRILVDSADCRVHLCAARARA